jgi:hypothetical protein
MAKLTEAPPMAETPAKPTSPVRNVTFRPSRSASRPPSSSRLAEGQGVRGDHPLPVHRGKVQCPLGRWQRDVHHREVQDDHQLRDADHAQDQPSPSAQAAAHGGGIGHETHYFFL